MSDNLTQTMREIHQMEFDATKKANSLIERLFNFAQNEGLTIPEGIHADIASLNEIYTALPGKRTKANELLNVLQEAI